MTIENLIKVVPPPAAPFEPFDGAWWPIETAVGTSLPPDFKAFTRLYGSGAFMDFIGIPTPRSSDRGVAYARWVGENCRRFGSTASFSHPVWPDVRGLFPVGMVENGFIFWRPIGSGESWRVAVWDRHEMGDNDVETFACDLTDFLAGLVTGDIAPEAFPPDLRYCDHLFRPFEVV